MCCVVFNAFIPNHFPSHKPHFVNSSLFGCILYLNSCWTKTAFLLFTTSFDLYYLIASAEGATTDMSVMAYENINVVAGVLKLYLRTLPTPLINLETFKELMFATGMSRLMKKWYVFFFNNLWTRGDGKILLVFQELLIALQLMFFHF